MQTQNIFTRGYHRIAALAISLNWTFLRGNWLRCDATDPEFEQLQTAGQVCYGLFSVDASRLLTIHNITRSSMVTIVGSSKIWPTRKGEVS